MGLIAMRVFQKLLARESAEGTIDGGSQIERVGRDVSAEPHCVPVSLTYMQHHLFHCLLATRTKHLALLS